jgi:H+/gluconate symporter-like permease
MPKITKALLVALGRHLAGNVTGVGEGNLATKGAGNLFGQVIMQSNVGESLSVNFCKIIH